MGITLSVYQLVNFEPDGNWHTAWDFVKANYGSDAVCRNVSETPLTEQQIISDLTKATSEKNELNAMLREEVNTGATHVFVQRKQEGAIFGIDLKLLK